MEIIKKTEGWKDYILDFNTVKIIGNNVKVLHGKHTYTMIQLDREPKKAFFSNGILVVIFKDGVQVQFKSDGDWDEKYYNYGKLEIVGQDVRVFCSDTEFVTISLDTEIERTCWNPYVSRMGVQVNLKNSGDRKYLGTHVYHNFMTIGQWMDDIKKICEKYGFPEKPKTDKDTQDDKHTYEIRFFG